MTFPCRYDSIVEHDKGAAGHAGVAELADARDLKSRGSDPVPVRPRSPAPYRGVEQLVARRAHNPEVGGSSPPSATISGGCNGFQLHPPVFLSQLAFSITPVYYSYKEE